MNRYPIILIIIFSLFMCACSRRVVEVEKTVHDTLTVDRVVTQQLLIHDTLTVTNDVVQVVEIHDTLTVTQAEQSHIVKREFDESGRLRTETVTQYNKDAHTTHTQAAQSSQTDKTVQSSGSTVTAAQNDSVAVKQGSSSHTKETKKSSQSAQSILLWIFVGWFIGQIPVLLYIYSHRK